MKSTLPIVLAGALVVLVLIVFAAGVARHGAACEPHCSLAPGAR
jgi:hypothetical protein